MIPVVTIFDRLVWLRDRFAPGVALTAFVEQSGPSHATVSSLYRRWAQRPELEAGKIPGSIDTWQKIARRWKVSVEWLTLGTGDPLPTVKVTRSELEGLSRAFADRASSGSGSYLATKLVEQPLPPQPLHGPQIPDDVRRDAATLLLARKRKDDPTRYFTRDEVWAGFRNAEMQSEDDARNVKRVVAVVRATILGEDEEPFRPVPSRGRAGRRGI